MAEPLQGMHSDDLLAFLNRALPALCGVVGTLRRDGSPHVVPVWYRYDGEQFHVWAGEERNWVKHLRRDSRVAFTVLEDRPPFAAVVVHGRAEVAVGDDAEILAEIRRITRRYIEEPEVEPYIARWPQLRTIVRIRPDQVFSWAVGY